MASLKDSKEILRVVSKRFPGPSTGGDLHEALLTYDSNWRRGVFKLRIEPYEYEYSREYGNRAVNFVKTVWQVTVTYVRNREDGRTEDILIWDSGWKEPPLAEYKARSEARKLATYLRKALYTALNPEKQHWAALDEVVFWDEVDTPTKRKRVTNAMVKVLKG